MYVYIIGGLIVAAGAYFCNHMGLFKKITFEDQNCGPFRFAYKKYTGPFSGVGPTFSQIEEDLKNLNIDTQANTIGMYFDDPHTVPENELRSYCGKLLPLESSNISNMTTGLSERGIKIKSIPQFTAKVTTFPLRNTLSYMLGAIRVYSSAEFNHYTPIEVYSCENQKITYIFPQEDLPEFKHEDQEN